MSIRDRYLEGNNNFDLLLAALQLNQEKMALHREKTTLSLQNSLFEQQKELKALTHENERLKAKNTELTLRLWRTEKLNNELLNSNRTLIACKEASLQAFKERLTNLEEELFKRRELIEKLQADLRAYSTSS